jgi:hypothetical protein
VALIELAVMIVVIVLLTRTLTAQQPQLQRDWLRRSTYATIWLLMVHLMADLQPFPKEAD